MTGHSRREKREAKDCDQISLLLPIDPVYRLLRPGICAEPVCADVQVNLFAVLEYLASEMLEMAINVVGVDKEMRIIPVSATSLSTDLPLMFYISASSFMASIECECILAAPFNLPTSWFVFPSCFTTENLWNQENLWHQCCRLKAHCCAKPLI